MLSTRKVKTRVLQTKTLATRPLHQCPLAWDGLTVFNLRLSVPVLVMTIFTLPIYPASASQTCVHQLYLSNTPPTN